MARQKNANDPDVLMPLTDARMREALPKQRRFLIVISLAIMAYYLLTVGVREEANYSGFGLTLAHPERVVWGLWIVWGWALLRYSQVGYALLAEIRDDLDMDMAAEDLRLATKAAYWHACELAASGKLDDSGRTNVRVSPLMEIKQDRDTMQIRRRGGQVIEYPSVYAIGADGSRSYRRIEGFYHWPNKDGNLGTAQFFTSMDWPAERVRKHRRLARWHATVRLQAVTEHVAPLVLAGLALFSPALATVLPAPEPGVVACDTAGRLPLEESR